jgi:DNA-binding GntR family transcriptional regulator
MRGEADAGRMPIAGDRRFHLVIAEAAGNGPLMSTVAELYDQRNEPLFEQLGAHFETVASWRKAIAEHEAVVDAIAARDAISARRAMQVHLQRSHDRFARAWPRKTPSRNGT